MSRSLLFILSLRGYGYELYGGEGYGPYGYPGWIRNSGLSNSAQFVIDMLNASGMPSELVQVNDQNGIDKVVTEKKPTDVILEAFWVDPAKVAVLTKLHPTVRWFCRGHSEIPFLGTEGGSFNRVKGYIAGNVFVASNTTRSTTDLRGVVQAWNPHWTPADIAARVLFLPNYYPLPAPLAHVPSLPGVLNVGCFGAIRPLKNQVYEAVAALELARQLGKKLVFHINGTRVEQSGTNVLNNIKATFASTPNATLVQHPWKTRTDFLDLCRRVDLGMQVSFTETFNIVTADLVTNNTPVVVSDEIDWVDRRFRADPTDRDDIIRRAKAALTWWDVTVNRRGLEHYNEVSRSAWLSAFGATPNYGWHADHNQFVAQPVITSHRNRR
jgi:hypothetical protein